MDCWIDSFLSQVNFRQKLKTNKLTTTKTVLFPKESNYADGGKKGFLKSLLAEEQEEKQKEKWSWRKKKKQKKKKKAEETKGGEGKRW